MLDEIGSTFVFVPGEAHVAIIAKGRNGGIVWVVAGVSKMSKNDTSKPSGTDWARLDAMTDAEIDLSDCPEVTPEMFARAIVRKGLQPKPPNRPR
jgi:hypothetical protein